ncbi:hypothetical protein Gotri_002788, partial [Gossypium trilobum]|nr:hypothetical protein [Gossypium trilobum]
MDQMPIWIQVSQFSLDFFTRKGLSYDASALGKPLYMDGITASQQRLAFAKVCVKIVIGFMI